MERGWTFSGFVSYTHGKNSIFISQFHFF